MTTTVRLGDLVDFYSGGTPSKSKPDLWNGAVPWFSAKDIKSPRLSDSIDHVSESVFTETSLRKLPAGTIVLVVRGMILAHTVPTAVLDVEAAVNQDLKALLPKTNVDTPYLAAMLRAQHNDLLSRVSTAAHGTKKLETRVLEEIPIPLPPMEEQRRIAAILDQADAIRTKRRQVLARLDALAQSTFYDSFGAPMGSGRWPSKRLDSIARIVRGASPRPAGDPRFFGGPIPWLKISDITAEPGPVVRRIKEGVTEAGRERSVLLPPRTLVLTNSATVGVSKIIEPATCIHDGFLAFLDLDESVDQRWLCSALAASRSRLVALAPEGTQKNLNGPIVKAVEFSVPPIELQQAFSRELEFIAGQRAVVERALAADNELFTSLQSRAFRGEL